MISIDDKGNIFGMFLSKEEIKKYKKYYIMGNRGDYYKSHKDDFLILRDNCYTCKHRTGNICDRMNIDIHDLDFSCDFHKRKNSGAFRRARRKANKEYERLYGE